MAELFDLLDQYKKGGFPPEYDSNIRRFYSPNDQIHSVLKELLNSASKSLIISIYGEDDPELTDIIIKKAEDPNIFVQINLDKTQASGRGEVPLVDKLRSCPNTNVAIGMSQFHKINHLKIAVVDSIFTLCGSTNWSNDGEGKQNNECSIIKSEVIAKEAIAKMNEDHAIMVAQENKNV